MFPSRNLGRNCLKNWLFKLVKDSIDCRIFSYNRWKSIKDLRESMGYQSITQIFANQWKCFKRNLPQIGNLLICKMSQLWFNPIVFLFYCLHIIISNCEIVEWSVSNRVIQTLKFIIGESVLRKQKPSRVSFCLIDVLRSPIFQLIYWSWSLEAQKAEILG